MEAVTGSLQNEYFNSLRKERKMVSVFLFNGKKLLGRIKSFDRFTLLLEGPHGDQLVFKHAIATVGLANRGGHETGEDRV